MFYPKKSHFSSIILLLFFLITNMSLGQDSNKDFVIKSKGSWKVPVATYSKVITNEKRKQDQNYDPKDSSITFFVDTSCIVYSSVKSKVVGVFDIEEGGKVIITKAGDYLITYTNIDNPIIKDGEEIELGQKIGRIYITGRKYYFLNFSIIKDKISLDPEKWLKW